MLTWEFTVLDFIQTHLRSEIGDTVMPFITHLGDGGAIWIVLALVMLIHPKTRRCICWFPGPMIFPFPPVTPGPPLRGGCAAFP